MAWARTSIHVQEYGTRHQHDFHLTPYLLESVLQQSLQPRRFSTQPSRGGQGGGLPIVGFLNCGPTCKANSNALSIYGCTLLPNTKTCIHSTPSVLLPPSWFIGPLCSLCQILTKDLTNKMLMHVKKNYLIGFVFEHSFQKYNVW